MKKFNVSLSEEELKLLYDLLWNETQCDEIVSEGDEDYYDLIIKLAVKFGIDLDLEGYREVVTMEKTFKLIERIDSRYMVFKTYLRNDKKTYDIQVLNNQENTELGDVKWDSGWRRYVFHPNAYTKFDSDCMNDIKIIIDRYMNQRKGSINV
jgi:hypothetical protein